MMNNADMPAMTASEFWADPTDPSKGTVWSAGLTKREWFAGLAMQALATADTHFAMTEADIAGHSVAQADALLAELERTK